jgi:hypothetical protein
MLIFADESENAIDPNDSKRANKKKHKEMKELYHNMKKELDDMRRNLDSRTGEDSAEFVHPRAVSLWAEAKKANFDDMELAIFAVSIFLFSKKFML